MAFKTPTDQSKALWRHLRNQVHDEIGASALAALAHEYGDDPDALMEFLEALGESGGDMAALLTKTHEPVSIDQFIEDDYFLGYDADHIWPENRRIIREIVEDGYVEALLMGAIGYGKAQPLSAKLLTPNGWMLMANIRVGDFVIGRDGKPTEVIGVFFQGVRKVFKVSFNDGASTRCCAEHLWSVRSPSAAHTDAPWKTASLSSFVGGVRNKNGQLKWHTPVMDAVEFQGNQLPIDPYVLGVLIGNGSLKDGVRFSSNDQPTIDRVSEAVPAPLSVKYVSQYDYRITGPMSGGIAGSNEMLASLRSLGLLGKGSDDKFIPQEYLLSSIASRIDLLHGLMDTDGWVEGAGGCGIRYSSNSSRLIDDVTFLVRSLGCTTKRTVKVSASGKDHHQLAICPPAGFDMFWLPRKKDAVRRSGKYTPSRMISSVDPDGSEECMCIKVAAKDQLYVTDDFVVTHNTTVAQVITAYQIYLLSTEKFPQAKYGLLPTSSIVVAMLNKTDDLSKSVTFGEFRQMMEQVPYFKEEFPFDRTVKSQMHFPNNILVMPSAAYSNKLLGMNIIGGIIDEMNFMAQVLKSKQARDGGEFNQAKAIYGTLVRRRKSRFMKTGKVPGCLLLVSSKGGPDDFLEQRARQASDEADKLTYVVDKPIWEIKPAENYSGKTFRLELGNERFQAQVLEDSQEPREGALTMTVPLEYKGDFTNDMEGSLRDLAGVCTLARRPYFWDRSAIWRMADDFKEAGNESPFAGFKYELSKGIPLPIEGYKCRDPHMPRVCHIDLGLTGDYCGLAVGYVSGIEMQKGRGRKGEIVIEEMPIVTYDVVLTITPPPGGEIEFSQVREILYLLRDQLGIPIQYVSFDQFQSADSRQILQRKRFVTFHRSVDGEKGLEFYRMFRSAVNGHRVLCPDNPIAFKELAMLEEDHEHRCVDHPSNGSKDTADGMCGVYATIMMRRHLWERGGAKNVTVVTENASRSQPEALGNSFEEFRKELMPNTKQRQEHPASKERPKSGRRSGGPRPSSNRR